MNAGLGQIEIGGSAEWQAASALRWPGQMEVLQGLRSGEARGGMDFGKELHGAATKADPEAVRDSAAKLVASAFLVPMLQEFRESSLAAGPFAPGAAEKRFGPLLDQHLADAITSSRNFPLVEEIVRRYGRAAEAASGTAGTGGLDHVEG